jgi:hypothetical protein
MSDERRKPGIAYSATVALVVAPILYILGSAPAFWLLRNEVLPNGLAVALYCAYFPIYWLCSANPVAGAAIDWHDQILFGR